MNTTLDAALLYHDMGLSTIPLAPGEKRPPKRFAWKQFQRRLPTVHELRDWHDRTDFGIAVVCGKVSGGLVVRDFDKPGAYQRFRDRNPDLCRILPAVVTGRPGGVHLWARCKDVDHHDLADGELRGEGHYVAAPDSLHASGTRYRWFHDLTGIPEIADPAILIGTSRKRHHTPSVLSPYTPPEKAFPPLLCVLGTPERAIAETLPPFFGTRNHSILRFCRALKALFPAATSDDVLPYVQEWHRQALPTIRTKDFRTTWQEFRHAYRQTRRGGNGPTWETVMQVASQIDTPLNTPAQRLRNLCLALHQVHGGASFPLSCRMAASYLEVAYKYAAKLIESMVQTGALRITRTYPLKLRRAHEYRLVTP
jgi:hypothetical protein